MSDMAERLISPISTAELERRWAAARSAMAAQKIDVLVMQNSNEFSGGYVKWFTDLPSGNGTMTTVIFPKDDLMTVVAPGPFGIDNAPPAGDPVRRGIKRFLASPNFMGASFTTALDLENIDKAMAEYSGATIGLIAQGSMGHALGALFKLAHGRAVLTALKAAELLAAEHDINAEVIDLRSLTPLDKDTIFASVEKTSRLVNEQKRAALQPHAPCIISWSAGRR
jgi:hypothetical protein